MKFTHVLIICAIGMVITAMVSSFERYNSKTSTLIERSDAEVREGIVLVKVANSLKDQSPTAYERLMNDASLCKLKAEKWSKKRFCLRKITVLLISSGPIDSLQV